MSRLHGGVSLFGVHWMRIVCGWTRGCLVLMQSNRRIGSRQVRETGGVTLPLFLEQFHFCLDIFPSNIFLPVYGHGC